MDRMVGILSPFIGVGLSSLSSSIISTKDTVMASINDPGIGTQARYKGVSMMDVTTMVPDTDMETTHPVVVVVMVHRLISALLECVKTTTVVQLVWPL
jgi:hypothetical protein